jgi:hypothetical protein
LVAICGGDGLGRRGRSAKLDDHDPREEALAEYEHGLPVSGDRQHDFLAVRAVADVMLHAPVVRRRQGLSVFRLVTLEVLNVFIELRFAG